MRKHQLQVHKLTILSMMIALDVVLTPIFRIEGMAPMSSVVNILAGIMMGPVYALAMATVTAFIRMTTQGIPPLALTGATFGALLAGLFYSTVENFTFLPWEKLWEQVLLVPLFPILLWYSLQDQLLSLAGLSTRLDFSEQL
ncbi:ThiW superfamily protein [Streptococcus pneumoniae]|nr:ThiW superfamily protein [Streptococcus pneumoniae]